MNDSNKLAYRSDKITVFVPNRDRSNSLVSVIARLFRNIYRSRDLSTELFKKQFFAIYKKSALGFGWILLSPIIGIASWAFMNATGVLKPGDVGIPYPAYVLLSTTLWSLFVGFLGAASQTLESGRGFIMQVNFPHETLFVQQFAAFISNFLLTFLLTLVVLLLFGVTPNWKLVFFPFLILPLLFVGGGLGLIVSVIGAVAADATRMITLGSGLLMFFTPVVYSEKPENPLLAMIVEYNPLTDLLVVPRDIIVFGHSENFEAFLIKGVLALGFFILSWKIFFATEKTVVERMI